MRSVAIRYFPTRIFCKIFLVLNGGREDELGDKGLADLSVTYIYRKKHFGRCFDIKSIVKPGQVQKKNFEIIVMIVEGVRQKNVG